MENVVIVGTGGHAKVVTDIVCLSGDNVVGFLTTDTDKQEFMGKPVLGKNEDFDKYMDCSFLIAIGDATVRERISKKMQGVKWYTAIHPNAVISKWDTSIGEGSVVAANAVLNPNSHVGKHCIINTAAVVEHDNIICDYAHISVGAKLAGATTIGERTWVGIGATVSNGVNICKDCMIGAGAIVVKNIIVSGTYVGVPAAPIKNGARTSV